MYRDRVSRRHVIFQPLLSKNVSNPHARSDLQFGDSASLLLILALISENATRSSVFFTFSYRDDEASKSEHFDVWLKSMSVISRDWTVLELKDLRPDIVNRLLSEALHLSPRITRPLASVLHHKTRGV